MMCWIYNCLYWISKRWLYIVAILLLVTLVFGMVGHYQLSLDANKGLSAWTILYQTIKLFIIDGAHTNGNVNGFLEVARWSGAAVASITIVTILVRLFSQRVLSVLVRAFAKDHVILCGLGAPEEGRERLVKQMREIGKPVVVLEPDPGHPSLETCRAAGAVCLVGAAEEAYDLERAKLKRSSAVVILGAEDRRNIDVLGDAVKMLPGTDEQTTEKRELPLASAKPNHVSFVVQVREPGLLEVLKRHRLHWDPKDRVHLRLFSTHEMAARAMLRETRLHKNGRRLEKILLVGVGREGRMGDALAMRAIKDNYLDHLAAQHAASQAAGDVKADPEQQDALEIHVLDRDSDDWSKSITARAKFLYNVNEILPIKGMRASRCGFSATTTWDLSKQNYSAVFVCIADESLAVLQATRIADQLAKAGSYDTPVIVRVREEATGFGKLFREQGHLGFAKNITPVGTHDRMFDIVASMHPTVEMVAQVLHQDYLSLLEKQIDIADAKDKASLENRPANRNWTALDEKYRESNRALARRLQDLMAIRDHRKHVKRRYRMEFTPTELFDPFEHYRLTDEELEIMAALEHGNWYDEQHRNGYEYAPTRWDDKKNKISYSPDLVTWDKLVPDGKERCRNIVRRLPLVLAKADYQIVPA